MNMIIKKNIPLALLTTFRIGGPAEYLCEPQTKEDLQEAVAWAKEKNLAITFLGGGSNVLINDAGIVGLVILSGNKNILVQGERIKAGAGAPLAKVLSQALSSDLSGLEWSHGIPRAAVGGSIRGNAGAFGVAMSDIVETVEYFDIEKEIFTVLSRNMCEFSYRKSLFEKKPHWLIWEAVFKLTPRSKDEIVAAVENALSFRLQKYPKLPSVGSVFKNLSVAEVRENCPVFFEREIAPLIGEQDTIGAGLIIDLLGLKGKAIGGAKVSLEHANHIVNTGQATADEVVQLISFIKTRTRNQLRINLKEELQYLGF